MTHAEHMARFIAGHWTKERPTEPGVYPARDSDGNEATPTGWVHFYEDPHDGAVKHLPGKSWGGDLWSVPWPGMPQEEAR